MDFADTPDQAELRSVVRAFTQRHATPGHVRAAMAGPDGYDPKVWRRLSAELGLTALAVPESFGGAGAGPGEVSVAVEEFGRVLLPSPYLSSAVAALALAGAAEACPDAAQRYLPGLADGSVIAAVALDADVSVAGRTITGAARNVADVSVAGRTITGAARNVADVSVAGRTITGAARNVVDGAAAGLLLVRAGDELLAVAAADATVEPLGTLDQTRRQAAVRLDRAPALSAGPAGLAIALQRVLLAAECAAAAGYCLEVTVAYLMTRRQFGRAIGSFQALKHRVADLQVAVTSARATARAAVWTAGSDPAALAALAPLAALHCARTLVQVAGEMIQLHGGIGFTWEHEAHLYLKRAKSTQLLLGPVSALRAEIGRAAGLLPAEAAAK
jgi:alkylation response protein AidB-like acyl-CoA dehydrogenase